MYNAKLKTKAGTYKKAIIDFAHLLRYLHPMYTPLLQFFIPAFSAATQERRKQAIVILQALELHVLEDPVQRLFYALTRCLTGVGLSGCFRALLT